VNRLAKFRYLGPAQTARKCLLRCERWAKRRMLQPPPLPPSDPAIDLQLDLLGQHYDLRQPGRWHRSPETGNCWPLSYAQAIPFEGPQAAGDVKFVWELNRHQFLPALAARDSVLTRNVLRDWCSQNPVEFGINWASAMEVGLRLIAWLEVFSKAPELRREFDSMLEEHARFVRHHLSADWIPRGNHLVGESAALVAHGGPHAAAGLRWLRQAAREQFYDSGVHREQSVAYHRFVSDLFCVARLRQDKAVAYLAAIGQPDGSLPSIGDSDDGKASSQPFEIPPPPPHSVAFPDAGHYVLRGPGAYCFIRCGEFGLPPNFAHAHADFLSPILWLGGIPVFVDSGTFTYNGDPQMRRYFRSAQAHNVVTVDDEDYAVQAGTFAWKDGPRGVCEKWTESEFQGAHDAYRNSGVTVRRRLQLSSGVFLFNDEVQGSGRHPLRWRFHVHPGLKITRCAEGCFELGNRFVLRILRPKGMRLEVGTGWYSPSYHHRVPVDVCEISLDATLPVAVDFALQ